MPEARSSDKSPDAFRTISEVADHLDLPQHVLRFWETKFPEIKPVKRAGGRRFYRPDDVDLLRAIRHLLYSEGYTIKGVQRILKDSGPRQIQAIGADLLEGRAAILPAKSVPEATPAGGRGGLLGGLLPRRKERPVEPDDQYEDEALPFGGAYEAGHQEPQLDAFLPGFEAPRPPREPAPSRDVSVPRMESRAAPVQQEPEFDEPDFDEPEFEAPPPMREPSAPRREPPPVAAESVVARPAPALRRPTRGPAARVPEVAPLPELEDPLLPFFDDEALAAPVDNISEPLDARIRRLKEHVPPPGPPEEYIPARARRRAPEAETAPRVGPLTGPFEDAEDLEATWDRIDATWSHGEEGHEDRRLPPEPKRHGPPEQYLPPHLRSEPRLAAAPTHPPQPVLSRDDVNRLQATLYELGECQRLLKAALGADTEQA